MRKNNWISINLDGSLGAYRNYSKKTGVYRKDKRRIKSTRIMRCLMLVTKLRFKRDDGSDYPDR